MLFFDIGLVWWALPVLLLIPAKNMSIFLKNLIACKHTFYCSNMKPEKLRFVPLDIFRPPYWFNLCLRHFYLVFGQDIDHAYYTSKLYGPGDAASKELWVNMDEEWKVCGFLASTHRAEVWIRVNEWLSWIKKEMPQKILTSKWYRYCIKCWPAYYSCCLLFKYEL